MARTTSSTRVCLQRILGHDDFDENNHLKLGELLKDMDISTCMSAESLTKLSCVTRTMDDLMFEYFPMFPGDVLLIRSQVNRAFNTSMECGVRVDVERKGTIRRFCSSYFVYVPLDPETGKAAKVPEVVPDKQSDTVRWALAADRRQIRLNRANIEDDVSKERKALRYSVADPQQHPEPSLANPGSPAIGSHLVSPALPSRKDVSMVTRMVLPPHCNHMGNTFGGQIMAWCLEYGTIVAKRHCVRYAVQCITIDDVFFVAPSSVGHRVNIKAKVNRVFNRSLEVGVRVEGCSLSGTSTLIAKCYFTFVASNPLRNLPDLGGKSIEISRAGSFFQPTTGEGQNGLVALDLTSNSNHPINRDSNASMVGTSPNPENKTKKPTFSFFSTGGGGGKTKSPASSSLGKGVGKSPGGSSSPGNKGGDSLTDDESGDRSSNLNIPTVPLLTDDDRRRHQKALGRRRIRLERMALRGKSEMAIGKNDTWVWNTDPNFVRELIHENLRSLSKAVRDDDDDGIWGPMLDDGQVFVYSKTLNTGVALKSVVSLIGPSPDLVFQTILDFETRKKWDSSVLELNIRHKIDECNDVVWMAVSPNLGGLKPKVEGTPAERNLDFSLLRSWRKDDGVIVFASHSISNHPEVPLDPVYTRGVVTSSGFILRQIPNGCEVTYILTVPNSGTIKMLIPELVGRSRVAIERMKALGSLIALRLEPPMVPRQMPSASVSSNSTFTSQSKTKVEKCVIA